VALGLLQRAVTPERLYLGALGLSGCAALVSVALPPAERGELAATIASATLGAAIGGLSVDTFLLSRPSGWVFSRGHGWILTILAGCLVLSAVVAALLTALAQVGSFRVGIAAAGGLTIFNASSSLALRLNKFVLVYAMRAAVGASVVGGYAVLYAGATLDGRAWSVVWLTAQLLGAAMLGAVVLRWASQARPLPAAAASQADYRADLVAIGKLHVGVSAQTLTYRLDQILVARFAGSGPLGIYALAVAAMEFAQAGSVVRAQRILADRGPAASPESAGAVAKSASPVALAAIGGLAVLGLIRPQYDDAWLLGVYLLAGTLAVAAGKTWSALLLKRRGEQATTAVALLTMVLAAAFYVILIPWAGATGAAVASSCAYLAYALFTRLSLQRAPRVLTHRMS
jgi:MFS family permease